MTAKREIPHRNPNRLSDVERERYAKSLLEACREGEVVRYGVWLKEAVQGPPCYGPDWMENHQRQVEAFCEAVGTTPGEVEDLFHKGAVEEARSALVQGDEATVELLMNYHGVTKKELIGTSTNHEE